MISKIEKIELRSLGAPLFCRGVERVLPCAAPMLTITGGQKNQVIKKQMYQEGAPKKLKTRFLLIGQVLHFLSNPDDDPQVRLVIPEHLIPYVIHQYHDNNGHMGVNKTFETIKVKYYFADQFKIINEYVNACVTCQQRCLTKKKTPVQEMDVPPYAFAKVSLDVSGPYPKSLSGNRYIIGFVDHFSGWPEAFATPDKSADTVAQLILEEIIPRHACPLQIVSDNGTENENRVMRETLKTLNIHHVTTSLYHPQSNAKVERFHRTLHDVMSKKVEEDVSMWDVYLNQCLSAIRVNVSETTGYSPYFLLYNRDPVLPLDTILKPRQKYAGEDLHRVILQKQHQTFTRVYRRIKRAQRRNIRYANKKAEQINFKEGDAVYVKKHQRKGKLDSKWRPYYRIVQQLSPATFKVRNQLDQTETTVHAEHLNKVKIGDWNIPEPEVEPQARPVRKTRLAVPDDSPSTDVSSSEDEEEMGNEQADPKERMKRLVKREREGSSSEDDIPLAELQKRLKYRSKRQREDEENGTEGMEADFVCRRN